MFIVTHPPFRIVRQCYGEAESSLQPVSNDVALIKRKTSRLGRAEQMVFLFVRRYDP